MPGFIRRFTSVPTLEQITAIEGVIIVDLPPPGAIRGIGTGVVALVGEFPDNTYACRVDSTGAVTSYPRAVDIFTGQDLLNKLGTLDATLGDFGGDGGNGHEALRNK